MSSSFGFYSLIASTISLIFITASTIFFALPLLPTDEEINSISSTCFDSNPHMQNALIKNRKNAFRGLSLLSLGVLFQVISISIQMIL